MERSFHIQWLACGFQWSFDGNHKEPRWCVHPGAECKDGDSEMGRRGPNPGAGLADGAL
jgi:hypothetical protein